MGQHVWNTNGHEATTTPSHPTPHQALPPAVDFLTNHALGTPTSRCRCAPFP